MYSPEDSLEAIDKSLQYNVFHNSFISGYLEKNYKQIFAIKDAIQCHNYYLQVSETINV